MPCEYLSPETLEKWNGYGCRLGHTFLSHEAGMEQGSQAHNSSRTTGLYRDEDIHTHSYVQTGVKSIKGHGKKVTEFQQQHGNYCCVLMNNKSHSYEEGTRALKQALPKPGPQLARELTTYMDKHGKVDIRDGNYKDGVTVSSNIEARTSTASRSVHKSKVLPSYIGAHQTLVTRLQEGPPSLFRVSSGYRAVSSQALFKNRPDTNVKIQRQTLHPLGEVASLNDSNSGKKPRSLEHSLMIEGHMEDYDSKRQLASRFVRSYPSIVHSFLTDDQEPDSSARSLIVPICTGNWLTLYLNEYGAGMSGKRQGLLNRRQESQEEDSQLESASPSTTAPPEGFERQGTRRARGQAREAAEPEAGRDARTRTGSATGWKGCQDQDGIGAGPGTRARDRAREAAEPGTERDARTRTGLATGRPATI